MKRYIVPLRGEEQAELGSVIRAGAMKKRKAVKRAYVLLAADENGENLPDSEIAIKSQFAR